MPSDLETSANGRSFTIYIGATATILAGGNPLASVHYIQIGKYETFSLIVTFYW